eukprot:jgi/Chrpa1/9016/Chrysochromulina_OHIO_Genome00018132-RA
MGDIVLAIDDNLVPDHRTAVELMDGNPNVLRLLVRERTMSEAELEGAIKRLRVCRLLACVEERMLTKLTKLARAVDARVWKRECSRSSREPSTRESTARSPDGHWAAEHEEVGVVIVLRAVAGADSAGSASGGIAVGVGAVVGADSDGAGATGGIGAHDGATCGVVSLAAEAQRAAEEAAEYAEDEISTEPLAAYDAYVVPAYGSDEEKAAVGAGAFAGSDWDEEEVSAVLPAVAPDDADARMLPPSHLTAPTLNTAPSLIASHGAMALTTAPDTDDLALIASHGAMALTTAPSTEDMALTTAPVAEDVALTTAPSTEDVALSTAPNTDDVAAETVADVAEGGGLERSAVVAASPLPKVAAAAATTDADVAPEAASPRVSPFQRARRRLSMALADGPGPSELADDQDSMRI